MSPADLGEPSAGKVLEMLAEYFDAMDHRLKTDEMVTSENAMNPAMQRQWELAQEREKIATRQLYSLESTHLRTLAAALTAPAPAEAEKKGGLVDKMGWPEMPLAALYRLRDEDSLPDRRASLDAFIHSRESDVMAFIVANPPAPAEAKAGRQWRHEKSGNTYHEVCRAHLCVSDAQPKEGDEVVIYQGVEGLLYAREDQAFRRRFTAQPSEAAP